MTDKQTSGNATVVRRLYDEVWNGRNFEILKEIAHPEAAESLEHQITLEHQLFRDVVVAPQHVVEEGQDVTVRSIVRSVHEKPVSIAGVCLRPSRQPVAVQMVEEFSFHDGRIIERIQTIDLLPIVVAANGLRQSRWVRFDIMTRRLFWLGVGIAVGSILTTMASLFFEHESLVTEADRCYHAMEVRSSLASSGLGAPPEPLGAEAATYAAALEAWRRENDLARAGLAAAAEDVADLCD